MPCSSLVIQPIWRVSQDVIVVTTFEDDPAERTIVYANSAFTALTGYDAAEAVGKPATICEGARTDPALLRAAELPLRAGEPYECIVVKYRRDGTDYCYRQGLAPLNGPEAKAKYLIESGRMIPAPFPHIDTGKQIPHFGLTLPMPLMEFRDGKLPKHLTSHPETDALQALWQQKRKNGLLPARADFTLGGVRRWASHLFIAAVLPDDRFQFTLFGSDLSNVYGTDLTGALLDELTPTDVWKVVIQHYREVVQSKQPLFCPISVSNGRWYTEVSRLLLPLSSDGMTVSFILGADYSRAAK